MFRHLFVTLLVLCAALAHADADKRRDPTAPARWQPGKEVLVTADAPMLMSVLIGKGRKLVVIDGVLLEEGEEKGGLRVWQVEADHVVVSVAGQSRQTLMLYPRDMNKEVR